MGVDIDGPIEVGIGTGRIFQIQVAGAAVGQGIDIRRGRTQVAREIIDRLFELLAQKVGHPAAVVGGHQIRTQLHGILIILQGIVVVAQSGAGDGAVLIGHRIDGIDGNGSAEVGFGAQQVVEVVFGHPAQKIPFVLFGFGTKQQVQHLDGGAVVAVEDEFAAFVKEVGFIELGTSRVDAVQCNGHNHQPEEQESFHKANIRFSACFLVPGHIPGAEKSRPCQVSRSSSRFSNSCHSRSLRTSPQGDATWW